MKKTSLLIMLLAIAVCLFGCNNKESASGAGETKITGSIAYFYGDGETAIKAFNSENEQPKEIELSKQKLYTIGLRPSFRGSKSAEYEGDCASFAYEDGCCEITYIGNKNNHPTYEFTITGDSDFLLTITVDDYTQTVKIIVQ